MAECLRGDIVKVLQQAKPLSHNKKEQSIQILPADKGKATVTMDKLMLEDEKTHVKLDTDLHTSIQRNWWLF